MQGSATLDDLYKVWEVVELKKMSKKDEARSLLDRICLEVGPLLKRKKWKVHLVKEFFPKDPSLQGLNVNRGKSIMLRLRPSYNSNELLPYEDVMGTMIHELTHMQISPHDASFYKLMDELADEISNDIMNISKNGGRIPQEPFSGKSHRIGGKFGRNVPDTGDHRRNAMANAASRRLMLDSHGRKLGTDMATSLHSVNGNNGNCPKKPLTREELRDHIARAAERRLRDNVWCPMERIPAHSKNQQHQHQQEQELSSITVKTASISAIAISSSKAKVNPDDHIQKDSSDIWICQLCSTPNTSTSTICSFCEASHPDLDLWICEICTLMNDVQLCECNVCGNSKYSNTIHESDTKGNGANSGDNNIINNVSVVNHVSNTENRHSNVTTSASILKAPSTSKIRNNNGKYPTVISTKVSKDIQIIDIDDEDTLLSSSINNNTTNTQTNSISNVTHTNNTIIGNNNIHANKRLKSVTDVNWSWWTRLQIFLDLYDRFFFSTNHSILTVPHTNLRHNFIISIKLADEISNDIMNISKNGGRIPQEAFSGKSHRIGGKFGRNVLDKADHRRSAMANAASRRLMR
eukprot:gene7975-16324_t